MKEIPLKTLKPRPVVIPNIKLKTFRTPKSTRVFRMPTKANLAACHKMRNFLPIKEAIQSPNNVRIGRIIIKDQKKGISRRMFLKITKANKADASPIIKAAKISIFFMFDYFTPLEIENQETYFFLKSNF